MKHLHSFLIPILFVAVLFSSCKEETSIYDLLPADGGYIKGTIKGSSYDGFDMNQSFRFHILESGPNLFTIGSTYYSFDILYNGKEGSGEIEFDMNASTEEVTDAQIRIYYQSIVKGGQVLFYEANAYGEDVEISDVVFDKDNGKLKGNFEFTTGEDDEVEVQGSFDAKVYEEVNK